MNQPMKYHDPNTFATDSGGVPLSHSQLWKLDPGARGIPGLLWTLLGGPSRLKEHLALGDSRAAIVMSTTPLLVAAYSDEIDGIVLLKFPTRLVQEFGLKIGSRLLTVNTYADGASVVDDLMDGERSFRRTSNVYPVIADFLTYDVDRLEARKCTISEEEWSRCAELGAQYMKRFPNRSRNGIPRKSFQVS